MIGYIKSISKEAPLLPALYAANFKHTKDIVWTTNKNYAHLYSEHKAKQIIREHSNPSTELKFEGI